jgi:hypothetical protein
VIFIALKLAKAGWMGSDPAHVLKADLDVVLNMLYYEGYEHDYYKADEAIRNESR